jgi:membrane fusion protein (multidrug efflux system)
MNCISLVVGRKLRGIVLVVPLLLSACSDSGDKTSDKDAPLPSVVVEAVTDKSVAAQVEYVGRTQASQRVDIRARVSGTLLKRPFEEGTEVEAGAVMFDIDPAEFSADLLSATANLAKAEASYAEHKRNLERYTTLVEKNSPAVSESQYDIAKSKADQAKAEVSAAQAQVDQAKLDLSYATIISPIKGRSGIATADVGNLIGPDSGVLVTVLNIDPIDVRFSIGERVYLNFMEATKAGTAETFTPQIKLANNKLYEHAGKIDVVDNKVDPATGTINIRLAFPNPDRILVPGLYVSVILTNAKPQNRVVVPQAAVQENQSGPFVLIVSAESRVEARPIKMGERLNTGVVVLEGLVPGETIITEGIQKVRPGVEVHTTYNTVAEEPEVVRPQLDAAEAHDGARDAPDASKSDMKAAPKAETKSEPKTEMKAEPKAEMKAEPDLKADPKVDPKAER